jgi:hypothetical protein
MLVGRVGQEVSWKVPILGVRRPIFFLAVGNKPMTQCREVVSLYDKTGLSLQPWVAAGYECFAYDIMNPSPCEDCDGVLFMREDLHDPAALERLVKRHKGCVKFLSAFPVCTDLSNAGANHWKRKEEANPDFQRSAASHAMKCAEFAERVGAETWYIENPRGALSKYWRPSNCEIHPYEYGGYLPENDEHPLYPEYIPPRDAYKKRTAIWHSESFTLPPKIPVKPIELEYNSKQKGVKTYSITAGKLGGGGGQRTKDIRSATPRGWALAVCRSNQ